MDEKIDVKAKLSTIFMESGKAIIQLRNILMGLDKLNIVQEDFYHSFQTFLPTKKNNIGVALLLSCNLL